MQYFLCISLSNLSFDLFYQVLKIICFVITQMILILKYLPEAVLRTTWTLLILSYVSIWIFYCHSYPKSFRMWAMVWVHIHNLYSLRISMDICIKSSILLPTSTFYLIYRLFHLHRIFRPNQFPVLLPCLLCGAILPAS